jgi:hypothetical protein
LTERKGIYFVNSKFIIKFKGRGSEWGGETVAVSLRFGNKLPGTIEYE